MIYLKKNLRNRRGTASESKRDDCGFDYHWGALFRMITSLNYFRFIALVARQSAALSSAMEHTMSRLGGAKRCNEYT